MSVLERIFGEKREEVAQSRLRTSEAELKARARDTSPTRGFRSALLAAPGLALIAEVKKASPSQGLIRADFDAGEIARIYEEAGAHCLSVLTDAPNFQGSLENLKICREAVSIPCLRKDFIFDPYQILEARVWGADAILLIVAMLEPQQVRELRAFAQELGLDVLVEVHDEAETALALEIGADLIGVNNRDLKDFHTSLSVSQQLIPLIRDRALAVSESALDSRSDLDKVEGYGAKAVLIGTSFCRAHNIGAKVLEVMGW